ncbi:biotin synthase [Thermodesulfatator indicus DSM 15286]|uniref:Biotin synthase n=1 Tax=Thermodesulfatator indicus (strain DSM 15286 / JCM 11887 / CIR29812) TaxID=667014 RepID=F8A800_THEID|nr:biotin synthase BioB [Thermodesulfatator indicus]AEH43916.1 biotin synthase [Thermodesulfatator indicus DSM 15286]
MNTGKDYLLTLLKDEADVFTALFEAKKLKEKYFGDFIETCSILNTKSGRCPSDCKFCAQSKSWPTKINAYPLLEEDKILAAAEEAQKAGIDRFSLVTSGVKPSRQEFKQILNVIETIKERLPGLKLCASLGQLTTEELKALKEAGLSRYHHNLETAESFYPYVCTTQQWRDRLKTAERVKEVGLSLCCGGIFGLGETAQQVIEFAETLQKLAPDSVPVNFLHPIPGTPLENASFLSPRKALAILAVLRFMLPDKAIRVCGGREHNLRDLQVFLLWPANALMVGNYLTTSGRMLTDDSQMIKDMGLKSSLVI